MQKGQLVLPEKCICCGGIFDLWHFLREQDEDPAIMARECFEHKEFLCWMCREKLGVLKVTGGNSSSSFFDEEDDFEFIEELD